MLRGVDATLGVEVIEPATTAMVEHAQGFTRRFPSRVWPYAFCVGEMLADGLVSFARCDLFGVGGVVDDAQGEGCALRSAVANSLP